MSAPLPAQGAGALVGQMPAPPTKPSEAPSSWGCVGSSQQPSLGRAPSRRWPRGGLPLIGLAQDFQV
jgi:hypothetical protein